MGKTRESGGILAQRPCLPVIPAPRWPRKLPVQKSIRIGDPVRHMAGSNVKARAVDVVLRVIEKDVRAECLQEWPLVPSTEKQRLVQPHTPFAQRADHPFMRRRRTRGDQRGADRRRLAGRKCRLQVMQRGKEIAERAATEWLMCPLLLMPAECFHPLFAGNAFALIAEDHRITVEGDT